MPDSPPPAKSVVRDRRAGLVDGLAGGALGLLLGLVIGLSASPVVNALVAGLVALLAGVFGLSEKLPNPMSRSAAYRLAAFGLAAALACPLGIYLRTSQLLGPSVASQRAALAEIGIHDLAQQNDMLRFIRFGLLPAGAAGAGKGGEVAQQVLLSRQPVLFASSPDFCAALRRMIAGGAGAAEVIAFMGTGDDNARAVAQGLKKLTAEEQSAAARVSPLFLCAA